MKLTAKDKKYIVDAFKKYISVCGNYLTCEECPYHTANQAFDKTLGTNNFRICQSIFYLKRWKLMQRQDLWNQSTMLVIQSITYTNFRTQSIKRLWRKCSKTNVRILIFLTISNTRNTTIREYQRIESSEHMKKQQMQFIAKQKQLNTRRYNYEQTTSWSSIQTTLVLSVEWPFNDR